MNDLNLFLRIKIYDTGLLAGIGNFFLAPFRAFSFGKSIVIANDGTGNIAKVTSFNWGVGFIKRSKQNEHLRSTWIPNFGRAMILGIIPADFITSAIVLCLLASLIPFTIIGSFFKLLSYLSPRVRDTHHLVKEKLTPKDKEINISETDSANTFTNKLLDYLMTGQKTNALIISCDDLNQDIDVNLFVVDEIKNINPSKLILKRLPINRINHSQLFSDKWEKSALSSTSATTGVSDNPYIVPTVEAAIMHPQTFFSKKHIVYVVKNDAPPIKHTA